MYVLEVPTKSVHLTQRLEYQMYQGDQKKCFIEEYERDSHGSVGSDAPMTYSFFALLKTG
jgi:hypothetical protein